ncbi:MAG: hypothetical protein WBO46_22350, partial [Caldilineaceae bacterium]
MDKSLHLENDMLKIEGGGTSSKTDTEGDIDFWKVVCFENGQKEQEGQLLKGEKAGIWSVWDSLG